MGAAGLTSSSFEMADRRAASASTLDLDHVPHPRRGHDGLRDHALGEPGAHADGAQAGLERPRPARSSKSGSSISRSIGEHHRLRGTWSFAKGHGGDGRGRFARSTRSPIRRRTMTARGHPTPPVTGRPASAVFRAVRRRQRRALKAADVASPTWRANAGSGNNTTTW